MGGSYDGGCFSGFALIKNGHALDGLGGTQLS